VGKAVTLKAIPIPPRRPLYRLRLFIRDAKEANAAAEEAARLFDREGRWCGWSFGARWRAA
jgi:hypothetical protein